jgi:hypothetical protein
MTNPWGGLDAATTNGELLLNPAVSQQVNQAFTPYESALRTLVTDALDDTAGYFGTDSNPLASILEEAFNGRGRALTTYVQDQLSQARNLVKTAQDAAAAFQAAD